MRLQEFFSVFNTIVAAAFRAPAPFAAPRAFGAARRESGARGLRPEIFRMLGFAAAGADLPVSR